MKKLALIVASLAIAAAPAFACPNMDSSESHDEAPRTAEKDKAKDQKGQDQSKAKEAPKPAPKAKEAPKTAKPEPKKPEPKKNDKVSQK